MRFSRLVLLPLVFLAVTDTYAQQPYVDPALRALLTPSMQAAIRRAPELGPQADPTQQVLAPGVALRKTTPVDVARVALFASIRSDRAIAELQEAGARIGSRVGNFVTAEVPLERLEALLASPSFEMFEAAREIVISNDSSTRVSHADFVRRAANGSWTGTTGEGVIVGVYDTGLDFVHEDFVAADGRTRVLALWDQTSSAGAPPPGISYGTFCSRAAIQQVVDNPANTNACPQADVVGHGTHVAGTAAGDGSAVGTGGTPFEFAGVAPMADLVIVKGGNGFFSESGIIDGLAWLESLGRAFNRPMVVNLSLGGQAGPHDGSRLYEAIVDQLSRPGFIVVFSAGNEGYNANDRNVDNTEPPRDPMYFHASGIPGITTDFTIQIAPYTPLAGVCNDFVNLTLWYEATDELDVSVIRPDGGVVAVPFGQEREVNSPSGAVRIANGTSGINTRNNAYEADIRFNDCVSGSAPAPGTWTLRVSSTPPASGKPYHMWMYGQSLGAGAFARGRQGFDNHYVVTSPGNARSAIAVGATATRLCWNSPAKPEGPVCFVTRESIGDLARFSSGGPSRDGRLKPEITAPGMAVASAKARTAGVAANRIMPDGVHFMNQGTSMAAPHVAGAIALLLQHRPNLTPDDVRDIFSRTADRDDYTRRVYDHAFDSEPRFWWGYGKLNICAALGALGASSGVSGPVAITPTVDTIPVNATTRFFSCSPTGGGITFHSTDPAIATITADGTVHALRLGSVQLVATSGTFADTAQLVVTDPANLRLALRDLAPGTVTRSRRGTRLPLLATTLRVNGHEAIRVTQLSYNVTGRDPAARVVLIEDFNSNGIVDFGEVTIASKTVDLNGTAQQVDVTVDTLEVSQRDSVDLILAVELSGAVRNATSFSAEFVAAGTRSTGTRSLAANRIEAVTTPVSSSHAITTVLGETETFSLSENPVRSGRLIFNFMQPPRSAGVYTLNGRLVANLMERLSNTGSMEWNLTNDDGVRVATGAYFAVFDFGGQIVREKIFVLRSGDQP